MTIPQKLKLIQKASGLTQEKLAQALDVSFVAFNNWITGKAQPRKGALERIDTLYREYIGGKTITDDALAGTKAVIATKQKQHPRVLRELLSKRDVYDAFMLALTFHSNRIEGSTLTENETASILFHNASLPNRTLIEQLEAKNHQAALEYVFGHVQSRKTIDEPFVLQVHRILMNGIDSAAGAYRRHGVRIVGTSVPTANYLSVPRDMERLLNDVRVSSMHDTIALVAQMHSRFEQIHPFADGNGRVGRLIMHALLLQRNMPPAVIEQRKRARYLSSLNTAQLKHDMVLLEDFVCDAVLQGYTLLERKQI